MKEGVYMARKTPTNEEIQLFYNIAKQLVAKIKEHTGEFKDKSIPVYIGIGIALVILALTVFWYIYMKDLAPLMIYMAMLIPILCFGLGEQSRNLNNLMVEFDEYNKAMSDFLELIGSLDEDKLSNEEKALGVVLASLIASNEKVVDDLTYGEIKQIPQYKTALIYAVNLAAIETSIDMMLEEEEDVSEILEGLDTSVIETGTYFDSNALYDIVVPDDSTTTTTASDEKSDTTPTTTQDQEPTSAN